MRYRKTNASPGGSTYSSSNMNEQLTQAYGSLRTNHLVGKRGLDGWSMNRMVDVSPVSSCALRALPDLVDVTTRSGSGTAACAPMNANHGAGRPMTSGPLNPSAARIVPCWKERGPRQNRPPYPAADRP